VNRIYAISSGKPLAGLAFVVLCCGFATSCGGAASGPTHSTSIAAPTTTSTTDSASSGFAPRKFGDYDNDDYYNDANHGEGDNDDHKPTDRDNDSDNPTHSYYDKDDDPIRFYGHAADAVDTRVITALVKRYYAAAAARDGATACTLIITPIVDSIPETLGGPAGPPYLQGSKTCPQILTKIFAQNYEQLSTYDALMQIDGVRESGHQALVIMRFKGLPAREIGVVDEHGTWKLQELLDEELP
jgi:hypothetical protein